MVAGVSPVVDCHFHVFDRGHASPTARYRPAYDARLIDWERQLSSLGVQYGVVVQTSFLGTDNTALLQALRAEPDRLRGVAVVDPDTSDADLVMMRELGVRGIRLNLFGDVGWRRITTPAWLELFARIVPCGWHVELHADNGASGIVLTEFASALHAAGISLPIVLDHFGRPGQAGVDDPIFAAVQSMRGQQEVWVKLSAPYRQHSHKDWSTLAGKWATVAGLDRLVWGSDWPWTNYEGAGRALECQDIIEWEAVMSSNAGRLDDAIRCRNAAVLYGFDVTGHPTSTHLPPNYLDAETK